MIRRSLALLVLILILAAGALAQEPPKAWPEPALYRLKNVVAADAAKAVADFAAEKKLSVSIVAEPVSNSLLVAGDPVAVCQVDGIITKMDAGTQQFRLEMTFLLVTHGFAERVGLACEEAWEPGWTLTAREYRMLTTAGLRDAKAGDLVEVLQRPQRTVAENQPAYVRLAGFPSLSQVPPWDPADPTIFAKVTPRLTPQRIHLDVSWNESRVNPKDQTRTVRSIDSAFEVSPDGGGVVARGPNACDKTEYLVIVKISKIEK